MPLKLSFAHKIMLPIVAATSLALCIFAGFITSQQERDTRHNLENAMRDSGNLTAESISMWFDARVKLAATLTTALSHELASAGDVTEVLERQVYLRDFVFAYLGQANGIYTTRSARPTGKMPDGYDPRVRPWYRNAADSGAAVITPPYVLASTGELAVTIATPLYQNGKLVGVTGGDLSLKEVSEIVSSLNMGGLGEAFLVDESGKVIASKQAQQVGKTLGELYPEAPPALNSQLNLTKQNGVERLVAFTPITGLPSVKWLLAVSVDRDLAYAPVAKMRAIAMCSRTYSRTSGLWQFVADRHPAVECRSRDKAFWNSRWLYCP